MIVYVLQDSHIRSDNLPSNKEKSAFCPKSAFLAPKPFWNTEFENLVKGPKSIFSLHPHHSHGNINFGIVSHLAFHLLFWKYRHMNRRGLRARAFFCACTGGDARAYICLEEGSKRRRELALSYLWRRVP